MRLIPVCASRERNDKRSDNNRPRLRVRERAHRACLTYSLGKSRTCERASARARFRWKPWLERARAFGFANDGSYRLGLGQATHLLPGQVRIVTRAPRSYDGGVWSHLESIVYQTSELAYLPVSGIEWTAYIITQKHEGLTGTFVRDNGKTELTAHLTAHTSDTDQFCRAARNSTTKTPYAPQLRGYTRAGTFH